MKKWIERLITSAGIAVGIFCYQVASSLTFFAD
jgi:hypothetical protein